MPAPFPFAEVQNTQKYKEAEPVLKRRMADQYFESFVVPDLKQANLDRDQVRESFDKKYGINTLGESTTQNIMRGLREGVETTLSGNLGLEMEARYPLGRLFTTDQEGNFHLWQSSEDIIPGFSEMDIPTRKKAILKVRQQNLDTLFPESKDDSLASNLSNIAASLLDPTTAIPIGGAALGGVKGVGAAAASGGVLAGVDAAAYTNAIEGEVNWDTVAKAGLIGATGAGLIRKGGQYLAANKADRALNEFTYKMAENRAAMDAIGDLDIPTTRAGAVFFSPEEKAMRAFKQTLKDYNMNELDLQRITGDARLPVRFFPDRAEAEKYFKARQKELFGDTKTSTRTKLTNLIEPLSDGLRKIDPKLWHRMRVGDDELTKNIHDQSMRIDPFLRQLSKLPKAQHDELWEAMANGNMKRVFLLGEKFGIKKNNIQEARNVLDDLYRMEQAQGRDIKYLEGYFPRVVKNPDKLKKYVDPKEQGILDKIMKTELTKAQKKNPALKELPPEEQNKIIGNWLNGVYDKRGKVIKPGFTRRRYIPYLTKDALNEGYHKPAATMHRYIVQANEDIYRRKILGGKVVNEAGDDIDKSVINYLRENYKGKLTQQDFDSLKDILQTRFSAVNHKPSKIMQSLKNLGYSQLLGNPWSAITQVGDVFLGAYRNGFVNTMQGLFTPASRLGKGLTPAELGYVHDIAQEFVSSPQLSKKILDYSFNLGGFKASDRMGKRAILRGAFVKYMKQARTLQGIEKLRKDWGYIYGDEFNQLVNELKAGKVTPRTKALALHELMDLQPVSQLEMPAYYLKYPGWGRLAYMLKTFSLKHLNLIRKDIVENWQKGNRKQAIKNASALVAFFTTGNYISGEGKAALSYLLSGDDEKWNQHSSRFMDSLLSNTVFMNRYMLTEFSREPTKAVLDFLAPPINLLDPYVRATIDMATGEEPSRRDKRGVLRSIPIVGRLMEQMMLGGIEDTLDLDTDSTIKIE